MDIRERIISITEEYSYKPLTIRELTTLLEVKDEELSFLEGALKHMETEGILVRTSKGKYVRPEMANMAVGPIQINQRGFGFVSSEKEDKDIFIPPSYTNGAMNMDKVLVKIKKSSLRGRRPEGEVVRILNRANTRIIGSFEKSRYFGFVTPDDRRIPSDIFIPKSEFNGAVTGCKVVVEIVNWPDKRRSAEGKVVEILGNCGEPGIDIISIAKSHGIETEFPQEVIEQVRTIPKVVEEDEIHKRRDLRGRSIVTIDGDDAKDLDDAVEVEKLPNGNYLLGVHIADVSHYVTEGSPLDINAAGRGTSVYLVDRVIPMLPQELSNGICSLNAGEDRLALSVNMEIDNEGSVVNHEVYKSVIKVAERMTYKDVTRILIDEDRHLIEKYKDHISHFKLMKELCEILRAKRIRRGSIDFDFPEVKITLDNRGWPVKVEQYEVSISNKIIEEFMLVCNETIAERMFWANIPFIYRIHEKPDAERIEALNQFLHGLGYSIRGINKLHPRALQEVMDRIRGKSEELIVSTVMLRSMQHAKYSHRDEGHFGLAAEHYCHFTSPIRRYPDLFIHRVISYMLKNNFIMDERKHKKLDQLGEERAKISSDRERTAELAERDVEDLKKVEFMSDKLGEVFEGTISSVTSFGFFVQLENTVEGLVHIDSLDDDYYAFDAAHYCLIGERTKRVFRIGDHAVVKLVKADILSRRLDFILEEEIRDFYKRTKIKRRRR